MEAVRVLRRLVQLLAPRHGDVKCFDQEVAAAGGLTGRTDGGMRTVPTRKVVGSVGRAGTLRSDFFYKHGRPMTERYVRIGKAMEAGKVLPPLELYLLRPLRVRGDRPAARTEYYVVDGHHRVAMARKLGQDYLDAHVVVHRVAGVPPVPAPPSDETGESAAPAPDASDAPDTVDDGAGRVRREPVGGLQPVSRQ
jgi:hypothetical protein